MSPVLAVAIVVVVVLVAIWAGRGPTTSGKAGDSVGAGSQTGGGTGV